MSAVDAVMLAAAFPKLRPRIQQLVHERGFEKGVEDFAADFLAGVYDKVKEPRAPRCPHVADTLKKVKERLGRALTGKEAAHVKGVFAANKTNGELVALHWSEALMTTRLHDKWPVYEIATDIAKKLRSGNFTPPGVVERSRSRFVNMEDE